VSVGKRRSASEPLTEHDVAERLKLAAMRVVSILADARQTPGLAEQVAGSRYLSNSLQVLRAELDLWDVEPDRRWQQDNAEPAVPALPMPAVDVE
jgi:hypothetical protein